MFKHKNVFKLSFHNNISVVFKDTKNILYEMLGLGRVKACRASLSTVQNIIHSFCPLGKIAARVSGKNNYSVPHQQFFLEIQRININILGSNVDTLKSRNLTITPTLKNCISDTALDANRIFCQSILELFYTTLNI